ncbi:hypothetical protein NBRC110019_24740 [Neptunitalea chrysea]|uniref:Uncharacterized protein n=1 Tax=Neptunitalea chrysea TaxID=1647581 RepID=A0A9W6B6B5_9FLAO|nr:hypothetical protein [Neptunitalea chrysea]GLB53433.1 hypothetical protein NBRC110019_24740 [Neptunitalea chrysea]
MELILYLIALTMVSGLILKRFNLKDFFKWMCNIVGFKDIPDTGKTTPFFVRVDSKNPNSYRKL